jgi:hypothetical protein
MSQQNPSFSADRGPARPQGGMFASTKEHGRVWVDSISSLNGTAKIKVGNGFGAKRHTVAISTINFERAS